VENGNKYFFSYFSANITEPRDTQSANLIIYDFYERHMEKIELNLNQSLIVFMLKSDSMVIEEFNRIKDYGKRTCEFFWLSSFWRRESPQILVPEINDLQLSGSAWNDPTVS